MILTSLGRSIFGTDFTVLSRRRLTLALHAAVLRLALRTLLLLWLALVGLRPVRRRTSRSLVEVLRPVRRGRRGRLYSR